MIVRHRVEVQAPVLVAHEAQIGSVRATVKLVNEDAGDRSKLVLKIGPPEFTSAIEHIEIIVDHEGQVSINRAGSKGREILQYDYTGRLVFLPTLPSAALGRAALRLDVGIAEVAAKMGVGSG